MTRLVAEFGTGQVLWSFLWFFLFFIWIYVLIIVFGDIFRSDDLSGWGKALWIIFVVILPWLGVLVYLIARGHKMQEHSLKAAQQADTAARQYIQSVSAGSSSAADQIAKGQELLASGAITQQEFDALKAKALAG
jgi:type VI protein secretion system component VasK